MFKIFFTTLWLLSSGGLTAQADSTLPTGQYCEDFSEQEKYPNETCHQVIKLLRDGRYIRPDGSWCTVTVKRVNNNTFTVDLGCPASGGIETVEEHWTIVKDGIQSDLGYKLRRP